MSEERYVELIRNYWLTRGYLVEPYIAVVPHISRKKHEPTGINYQAVRSNMLNGMPHPGSKVAGGTVAGDDLFLKI